jgi:DNA-binding ferritin-like protein
MKKFTEFNKRPIRRIVENDQSVEQTIAANLPQNINEPELENSVVGEEGSNVTQFFSKLFESREMAHVYHLQVKGEQGSYATHEALGDYYENIIEILDDTIEVYQGQYGLVDGYDTIDTSNTKSKEPLAYFEELAEYVKHGKKCISEEDTHTHSLIDDIMVLIYKTVYKLKFLK